MASIPTFIKLCILSGILLVIFPILCVCLFIPALLYRQFIKILAHTFYHRKGLGKILTSRASVFNIDEIYTKPQCTFVVCATLKGNLEISTIRKQFLSAFAESKSPLDINTPKFPELKQYLFKFGGYSFWKDDATFNIDDHVYYHKEFVTTQILHDTDIHKIREELIHKTWRPNKPLWELIVVRNFHSTENTLPQGPLTICFFRVHHTLTDGKSLFNLLINSILKYDNSKIPNPRNPREQNILSRIFYALTFPLTGLYALAKIFTDPQTTSLSVPESKQHRVVHSISPLIPIKMVQQIKNHFNVSFNAVLLAAISGVHRERFITKNIHLPPYLKCFCPFPMPNHSGKLRNHMTIVTPNLPVSEATPLTRLLKCHKIYQGFRKSPQPVVFSLLSQLIGILPEPIFRRAIKHSSVSTGVSIFPAGFDNKYLFQDGSLITPVVDVYCVTGLLQGTAGAGFFIISYDEGIRVYGGAYDELMTQSEVNEFTGEFTRQLEELHKLIK